METVLSSIRNERITFIDTGWTIIVYTFNNDIKTTINKISVIPYKTLKRLEDLLHFRELAKDMEFWKGLIKDIYKIAEEEKSN